ncbi:MAG: hypothetical protein HY537_11910, partial [Deltaproteobacteria bacterium]|nr:hypothetical protein [Deltaproteobacteria bacterium]
MMELIVEIRPVGNEWVRKTVARFPEPEELRALFNRVIRQELGHPSVAECIKTIDILSDCCEKFDSDSPYFFPGTAADFLCKMIDKPPFELSARRYLQFIYMAVDMFFSANKHHLISYDHIETAWPDSLGNILLSYWTKQITREQVTEWFKKHCDEDSSVSSFWQKACKTVFDYIKQSSFINALSGLPAKFVFYGNRLSGSEGRKQLVAIGMKLCLIAAMILVVSKQLQVSKIRCPFGTHPDRKNQDFSCVFIKNGEKIAHGLYFKTSKNSSNLLVVGKYRYGERHGLWAAFYANGAIWNQATYNNGILDGRYTEWHPNGKISLETRYSNGRQNGSRRNYLSDGKLVSKMLFVNGVRGK